MAVSHKFKIELIGNATGLFRDQGDGSLHTNSCARTVGALRNIPKQWLKQFVTTQHPLYVLSGTRDERAFSLKAFEWRIRSRR